MPVDEAEMEAFIISGCLRRGILLSYDELEEVLEKELIYLRMIGAIDEDNGSTFLN